MMRAGIYRSHPRETSFSRGPSRYIYGARMLEMNFGNYLESWVTAFENRERACVPVILYLSPRAGLSTGFGRTGFPLLLLFLSSSSVVPRGNVTLPAVYLPIYV